jgi:hypothetical protein
MFCTRERGASGPAMSRHRPLLLATILLVVVGIAGGTFAWRWSRRGPDQASVPDAVDRFRSSSTMWPSDLRLQPPAGVYVYAGEGSERLSFLDTHQAQGPSMPGTVTIQADGCWVFRLDYNSYHSQTWRRCPEDGKLRETGGTTDQKFDFGFFKQSEHSVVTCDRPVLVADLAAPPGTVHDMHCTGRSTTTDSAMTQTGTFTLVGPDTVDVGGQDVAAVHGRQEVKVSGDQTGTVRLDIWFAASDGLPLREEHHISVVSPAPSPIDEVTYTEDGAWKVSSLSPTT